MERKGLNPDDRLSGADADNGFYTYTLLMRNNLEQAFSGYRHNSSRNFEQLQAKGGMNPELYARDSDHLRPGERVKIVAINRATGYVGTITTTMQAAGSNGNGQEFTFPIGQLRMGPPNLKIWAERKSTAEQGLTQGKQQEHTIGNEGAGLGSDEEITITTEWLDRDGSALPAGLNDYGYTGRVARVVAANTLAEGSGGNSVSQFPIRPGRQLQVLRLPQKVLAAQHLYVQVSGEASSGNPDFSSSGVNQGILQHRPDKFVPFQVPVYDETASLLQEQAYKKARTDQPEQAFTKPKPLYQWAYRPELQFSVYDLTVDEVRREDADNNSEDILNNDKPVLTSTDEFLKILYQLQSNTNDPLESYSFEDDGSGNGKELVFALGEQELKATVTKGAGDNQKLEFDDLSALSALEAEDFLSMRLYTNNDAGNILWEWAFAYVAVAVADDDVLQGEETIYVSADNSTLDLTATLYGYTSADDEVRKRFPQKIQWKVLSGNATISPQVSDVDEAGNANVVVSLQPKASNVVKIEAVPIEEQFKGKEQLEIAVIPGKPAQMGLTKKSDNAYIKRVGEVEVEALVKDQHGNIVVNGTGVDFRTKGHISVERTTGITDEGRVRASISAGSVAGSFTLKATSGFAEATIAISAKPLDVEIIGLPNQFVAGQKYNLIARIGGAGEDLSNIYVDLGSSAGSITAMDLTTNRRGEVNFTYKAPYHPGNIQLAAKVDIENPLIETVNVVASSQKIKPAQYFLIAGTDGSESSITSYDGRESQLSYPTHNLLSINGSPGSHWAIHLDNKHLVNREPLYFNRFTSYGWDVLRRYRAEFENIVRLRTPFDGIGALKFLPPNEEDRDWESVWRLKKVDSAESAQPAFNFWLKPNGESDGELLNVSGGAIVLDYSDSVLTAKIRVLQSDQTTATSELELPVSDNLWQAVTTGVKDGQFYLKVDDHEVAQAVNGTILYGNIDAEDTWLTLGKDYEGQLAGLRIYNWESPALLAVNGSNSGVFDEQGTATVSLNVSSSVRQNSISLPSVSVAVTQVSNSDAETRTLNVLKKSLVERMAAGFFAVNTTDSATSEAVLQQMPMDEYFPSATNGVRTFVQRFAVTKNSEAAKENTLANMAWLSHSSQFESLREEVTTLQAYFADEQHPHLASFSAEYLQEATVQAAQGNSLWLRNMATSLTVWAELVRTDPAMANRVAQAIESSSDFWLWNRVMSLPADGWATDSIPIPRPDVTCDTVTRDVNVGTPLAYGSTPCRATGQQMATMLGVLLDVDPDINNDPALMTMYMSTLLSAFKQLPLEYKRIFPKLNNPVASQNVKQMLFPDAHAAGPFIYAFRMVAIAMKQAIRKGLGGGPANFVAFLQGGTTSRVDTLEMLTALAYLGSRLDGVSCDGCKALNPQVSETVVGDMGTWFAGLALSKKGEIKEPDLTERSCTITGNAHGKAFELLGTAAYHAMYEFGGSAGERYNILLSDPREGEDIIKVGLMQKDDGDLELYDGSPHQRKPDLVLEGDGERNRHWVELKSWRYNKNYLTKSGDLQKSAFPIWDGRKKGADLKRYTVNAHRQHFLDYAASRPTLTDDYWRGQSSFYGLKPNKHETWFQVWTPGKRTWKHLRKEGDKWVLDDKSKITRNVATPWLGENNVTNGVVTSISPQFKALQRYLSSAPTMSGNAFESSIGYKLSEHEEKYIKKQESDNVTELPESSIKPFTLTSFFVLNLGESAGKNLKSQLIESFGDGDLADLQKAIDSGELTQEQVDQLRKNITDKILDNLGPISILATDIPGLSWLENKAADQVLGQEVEAVRKWVSEYELPEDHFEQLCEYL